MSNQFKPQQERNQEKAKKDFEKRVQPFSAELTELQKKYKIRVISRLVTNDSAILAAVAFIDATNLPEEKVPETPPSIALPK